MVELEKDGVPEVITFRSVALKGPLLGFLLSGVILILVGLFPAIYLSSMDVHSYSNRTNNEENYFMVSEYSEQPTTIKVSADFEIESNDGVMIKVKGKDTLAYNISIKDRTGKEIYFEQSTIRVPFYVDEWDIHGDQVTASEVHEVELKPGNHTITLKAERAMAYEIKQRSVYLPYVVAFTAMVVIGAIIAIAWLPISIEVYKKSVRKQLDDHAHAKGQEMYAKDYEARDHRR